LESACSVLTADSKGLEISSFVTIRIRVCAPINKHQQAAPGVSIHFLIFFCDPQSKN
jgi:hypothetical protein